MTHLLIVDDEKHFRNVLLRALRSQGFRASAIDNADAIAPAIAIQRPDVILLDLLFDSGASGLEACRIVRRFSSVPIIVVSISHDQETKIRSLDAGADDYLTKPFSIEELVARIKAVQRRKARAGETNGEMLHAGDLTLMTTKQEAVVHGNAIRLTPQEYRLLRALVSANGKSVSYRDLIQMVYGRQDNLRWDRSSIRVLVRFLRKKLGDNPAAPYFILTEPRTGYWINSGAVTENPLEDDDPEWVDLA